ncbi:MAG TPA: hypothetical protein VF940_21620 [Streptosporangiaceae bacterium]
MTADLEKLLREGIDRLTADATLRPDIVKRAQHDVARRSEPGAVISRRRRVSGTRRHRSRRRIRVIAPLAAATAMACVAIAVAVVGNGGPPGNSGPRTRAALPSGTPAPRPSYFLGIYSNPGNDLFSNLAVYHAATGAVVTDLASRTRGLTFTAVAATASSTEFLAAAEPASGGRIGCGATIYRVKLTAAGRLAALSPLPGAPHPGYVPVSGLQVSADGSTLAIESGPCYVQGSGSFPYRIELLRLADGRARRWRPAGPTIMPFLGSLSSDGRSLAFSNYAGMGTGRATNDGAARVVRASAKSGSLTAAARVVVPGIRSPAHGVEGVALSPDGKVLYACSRRAATAAGYHYSAVLAAYNAASGRKIRVLGSWNSDQSPCLLAMAPSGDYALVTGLFTAPGPYAYRVNLSTGKKAPVGRAFTPGRPAGDTDPGTIAW